MTLRCSRNARIVATLGPASSSPRVIEQLFRAAALPMRCLPEPAPTSLRPGPRAA